MFVMAPDGRRTGWVTAFTGNRPFEMPGFYEIAGLARRPVV